MRWLLLVLLSGCGKPVEGICGRGYQDAVSRALCATPKPEVVNLVSLELALGLAPELDGPTTAALNGNSASLVARLVSPLNPRLVMLKRGGAEGLARRRDPDFVVLAFTRGERFVELVARDRGTGELRFFLVTFTKTCGEHCELSELFTEEVEKGWTSVAVSADDDLKNTPSDCLRCHQPAGPSTPKLLRMQELKFPWTHWLAQQNTSPNGQSLLRDFTAAHPATERYGGVPVGTLAQAISPAALEALVEDEGYARQPNEFDSVAIDAELSQSGDSPTWNGLYRAATTGEAIAVPYSRLRATDPDRQALASRAYLDFAQGNAAQPGDLRGLLTLDAERAMGIRPSAGASGKEILVQLCQHCHNSRLDQSLTRARFNVETLAAMSRAKRSIAISRMTLAEDDPKRMPPASEAYLSPEELVAAISELSK